MARKDIQWDKAYDLADSVGDGVESLAHRILERAQQLCPVDTGELKRSGYVRRQDAPQAFGTGILNYAIGFTAEHAALVHERIDIPHKNGEAKFLEKAIAEIAGQALQEIDGEVKI